MISRFQDIAHLGFPIDFQVKISKCHKIFNFWQIAKTFITTFHYNCLTYYKVWLRSDQNCKRSNILKFRAPYSPVLTKISKCHKIFTFGRFWQKKVLAISPHDQHTYNKFWLKLNENCGSILPQSF